MNVTPLSAKQSALTRRDFMRVLTRALVGLSGVMGLAGVMRYLSYESAAQRKEEFDLGPASEFSAGSASRVDEIPAIIWRTDDGFAGMSLECTHLGCTVEDTQNGLECPCHGSRYDPSGAVIRGPARDALRRLRAEVNADGRLIVYRD